MYAYWYLNWNFTFTNDNSDIIEKNDLRSYFDHSQIHQYCLNTGHPYPEWLVAAISSCDWKSCQVPNAGTAAGPYLLPVMWARASNSSQRYNCSLLHTLQRNMCIRFLSCLRYIFNIIGRVLVRVRLHRFNLLAVSCMFVRLLFKKYFRSSCNPSKIFGCLS